MNRRGFLRLLGGAVAAAVAPTKTYAFFGEILRPKPMPLIRVGLPSWQFQPGLVIPEEDWRHSVRIANIDISLLVAAGPELTEVVRRLNINR